MSTENTINDILQNLKPKCAVNNFSLIAGICSPAKVASALNLQRPFDNQDAVAHLSIARRLRELQDAVSPVPVDWSEVVTIKALLAGIKDNTLHISVHQERPIEAPELQYLVFFANQYFVRRRPTILDQFEIVGSFQSSGASKVTKELGNKLAKALQALGHRAQIIPSKTTDSDGPCDNFEVLWGEAEKGSI
jgi:hypothetical protein